MQVRSRTILLLVKCFANFFQFLKSYTRIHISKTYYRIFFAQINNFANNFLTFYSHFTTNINFILIYFNDFWLSFLSCSFFSFYFFLLLFIMIVFSFYFVLFF